MNKKIFAIVIPIFLFLISEAKAEHWETSRFCTAGWGYNISCFIQPLQFPLDCQNPYASLFLFLNNTISSCWRKIFYNNSYYSYTCPRYKDVMTCLNKWGACCDCEGIKNGTYYIPDLALGYDCYTYCTVFCPDYDQILTGTVAVPSGGGITEAIADFCYDGGWNHTTASPFFVPGDYVYANASYTYYNFTSSSFLFANLTLSCERTNVSCPEQCMYSYENYKFAYWHYYNGRNVGGKCVYDLEECPYGCDGVKCAGAPTPPPPVCGNGVCESGETYVNCPSDCPPTVPVCGNGVCEPPTENVTSCPQDCGYLVPIPQINITEWQEMGYGWLVPLFSPFAIYNFVMLIFAVFGGAITREPSVALGVILIFVVILTFIGIYPWWLGFVLIIIAGFLFVNMVGKFFVRG